MVPLSTNNKTSVTGDGTEQLFTSSFTIYASDHLEVYLDGVLLLSFQRRREQQPSSVCFGCGRAL